MEDNWYYIKTWERMEEEFGFVGNGHIATYYRFTKQMEQDLPPTRCIYVKQSIWNTHKNAWCISEDMIETPAFKIGENVLVRDDNSQKWKEKIFNGYLYNDEYPFKTLKSGYAQCKKDEQPKQPVIEITVKINNKECKLSDISEETLLKLRHTN